MVDFGKPPAKPKSRRFGVPPEIDDASTTLEQPEHAPAAPIVKKLARKKTGRTEPFGTRTTAEFIKDIKRVAFEEELKMAELLELMLEAYKDKKRKS